MHIMQKHTTKTLILCTLPHFMHFFWIKSDTISYVKLAAKHEQMFAYYRGRAKNYTTSATKKGSTSQKIHKKLFEPET